MVFTVPSVVVGVIKVCMKFPKFPASQVVGVHEYEYWPGDGKELKVTPAEKTCPVHTVGDTGKTVKFSG